MPYAFLALTFANGYWCMDHTLHNWSIKRKTEVTEAMIGNQNFILSTIQIVITHNVKNDNNENLFFQSA